MLNEEKWRWVDEDPFGRILLKPEPSPLSQQKVAALLAALLATGEMRFAQHRFEEAAANYSAAVVIEPNHRTAHFDLAVCLEKTGRWEAALNSFRRALEIDPSRVAARVGGGACLLRIENNSEALAWFERSVRDGAGARGLLGQAVALQRLGQYEHANDVYLMLLRIDPDATEPLENLIALGIAREDIAAADKHARHLLRVNPRSKAALQGLATVAIRKGDAQAAIENCTRLLEADPESFEGWFNLRIAQQRLRAQDRPERSIA